MLITYLTIEDIESGLFQTQVLDILTEISNQSPDLRFEILVVNRPWLIKSHLRRKKQLEKVLKPSIRIRYIPLLPPLRNAMSSFWYSAIFTNWLRLIFSFAIPRKSEVLHCRSYWPTQAALKSRNIPVVFDMRSLWPLENMSMGLLKPGTAAERYWLALEKECLERSAVSAAICKGIIDYVDGIVPGCKIELIPISVDKNKFRFDENERTERRAQLGWKNNTVLVYSGSFGQASINLAALKDLFSQLLQADESARLLFLTSESDEKTHALMKMVPGATDRYKVVHPKLNEIGKWLSAGDIGVHALPRQLDYTTRLGTKIVECWINGMPVIVNEYVGAAADFIKEFNVGGVLAGDKPTPTRTVSEMMQSLLRKNRKEQTDFANAHFATDVTARQYIDAYRYCVAQNK